MSCKPNCGDCCGCIPIELTVYENAESEGLLQVTPTKVVKGQLDKKDPTFFVLALTEDLYCVFLNRTTKLCVIYFNRPYICRIYGSNTKLLCPYFDTLGRPRSVQEVKRVKLIVDKQIDARLKDLKGRMNIHE